MGGIYKKDGRPKACAKDENFRKYRVASKEHDAIHSTPMQRNNADSCPLWYTSHAKTAGKTIRTYTQAFSTISFNSLRE